MNKTSTRTLVAIALVFGTANAAYSCMPPKISRAASMQNQVGDVVSHLVGVMDTSAQAEANSKAPNVRMTTCKVTLSNTATSARNRQAIYLYQEQAMSQNLAKPYRQRFLRIAPSADNQSVESAGFKPPTPQAWIGLCDRPEAKRIVTLNDIGKSECSVFLKRDGENYIGETQPGGCPTNYKGAVRITNRIVLHPEGMDTLDRGLDASGNVVWGAKDKPYQFRWITQKVTR